ncbi:MAG: HNH endonuclease [Candidatus Xenobiia bacterium LiM19]
MVRRKRLIQSRRTYKDSTPDENLQAGRAGASEQDADLFDVKEGAPLVPRELHELARHINSRSIDREEDFITFDYHLCRLSQARSLIDLCLGELLSAFRKRDGKAYGEMGYSRLDDFTDEHLSFSGRLASEMILNYERLQALPLTREAYIKGDIVKSALRLLLRVTTKENEAELLSEIRELSVREIDKLVKVKLRAVRMRDRQKNMAGRDAEGDVPGKADAAGASATADSEEIPSEEADREEGSGVVMKFNVPRTLALTWDFALEHFRENDKTKGPLYGFVEALVSSFLDSTADLAALKEHSSDAEHTDAAEPEYEAEPEVGADAEAEAEARAEASLDGPAFVGNREVPLLYTDAIWDSFPSEREMRARNRNDSLKPSETGDCRSAEAGDCQSTEPGSAKPEDSGDEYPNPQNEERLRHIREELALQPFVVKLPEEYSQIPSDPYMLSHKIISVAQMRQSIDYHIGWFLKAVHDRRLFRIMEFSKIEDYAKARINISASTTFRLIRLVSYFENHPVIEKAFLRRKVTREQAYLIASLEDGRHEKIWLDFAMSRPAKELRDEVNRMLRIKEYDYFAPHSYALLPGFRYITDDRYNELSDEMKDILRTGAWYQGPGSQWPLASHDEHFLEKDFADKVAEEPDTTRLSKCAADQVEETDQVESSQLSKCDADIETGACQCMEGEQQHSDEALETVRTLCTLPDRHRPATTLLLDVLESLDRKNNGNIPAASTTSDALTASAADGLSPHRHEPAMSIRFFIPHELYGIWNEAVHRYVSLISPDDGVELLVNNEGVENFIALLLTEYLLAEKAHHKAAHNNKVLERDGYKCQVPGCSNRRNIHAHHLEFRSHGGCDGRHNLLSLCASHHLWILHILHGLKIEGTAPDELTFTFGPCSSPEGEPFMVYSSGRKVLAPAPS